MDKILKIYLKMISYLKKWNKSKIDLAWIKTIGVWYAQKDLLVRMLNAFKANWPSI